MGAIYIGMLHTLSGSELMTSTSTLLLQGEEVPFELIVKIWTSLQVYIYMPVI